MTGISKAQRQALDVVVDLINNSYDSQKGEKAILLIGGILNIDMSGKSEVEKSITLELGECEPIKAVDGPTVAVAKPMITGTLGHVMYDGDGQIVGCSGAITTTVVDAVNTTESIDPIFMEHPTKLDN